MGKLNKSESKGLIIFSMLGVLVMAIGVVMSFLNQNARGKVKPMDGEEMMASLSGRNVIWVSIRKEDKAE